MRPGRGLTGIAAMSAMALTLGVQPAARADDAAKGAGTDQKMTLAFGGQTRSFLVHVPGNLAATDGKKFPLVLMLHGAGGDGEGAERQTSWDKKADSVGFIVVFPDALPANPAQAASFRLNPRFWDDGSGRGGAQRGHVDDLGFLSALLDDVQKRYPVDTQRIYLTGFSSGASMTFAAAVSPQLSSRLAAAAPVAGQLWEKASKPTRAVSLLLLFGTADPLNPMQGGMVKMPWGNTRESPKVMDTVDAYAKAIDAPENPAPIDTKKPGVRTAAYGPGRDGSVFLFVTIEDMGHDWPGGKSMLPESVVGKQSNKLNATDVIWSFFSKHVLADRVIAP